MEERRRSGKGHHAGEMDGTERGMVHVREPPGNRGAGGRFPVRPHLHFHGPAVTKDKVFAIRAGSHPTASAASSTVALEESNSRIRFSIPNCAKYAFTLSIAITPSLFHSLSICTTAKYRGSNALIFCWTVSINSESLMRN